jgi:hypothetical protein
MACHTGFGLFESNSEAGSVSVCRELRIYRPDGTLSIIYFTAFGSDQEAIYEAENIARRGYQIDVWRDGTRIGQISDSSGLDKGEHQLHSRSRAPAPSYHPETLRSCATPDGPRDQFRSTNPTQYRWPLYYRKRP